MQNSKKTFSFWEDFVRSFSSSIFRSLNFLSLLILFYSCRPTGNPVYFKNLQRDTSLKNIITENYELRIRKNDLLGITVISLSPDVAFYNAQVSSGTAAVNGYPVNGNGNISFVKLGDIHAEGLTRKELKDTLEKLLVPYLKDVVVTVSFLNRHITMLGGVNTQVLPIAVDNMTIFDALAASGDIGEKGRIDNVLVIRDSIGVKEFKRLNLSNHSIFYSPYYYMQPNDIVYVEPVKVKTKITTAQIISYITSGISLIILILNSVKL